MTQDILLFNAELRHRPRLALGSKDGVVTETLLALRLEENLTPTDALRFFDPPVGPHTSGRAEESRAPRGGSILQKIEQEVYATSII